LPAPAEETVSASLEDTVRLGKAQACVENARLESVARFGRGVRLVVVVVGSVDERRHRSRTSSADDERGMISPPDRILRHLNWDGSFLGTQTKHGTLRLKKKLPFLFVCLSWTGKIGQSAI